jgi:hypothetical protein
MESLETLKAREEEIGREWDGRLIAVCKRCLNRSEIKSEDAITTLGRDFPLFGLRKVLRCRRCKVRGLANVHEVWP